MYASFYGLHSKPFQISPDPRYFFNSKGHHRALSYLRYGVQQGDGFIVVTGDVGTGKTTLVKALSSYLASENIVVAQLVTTQLDDKDLLRMVAAGFGLTYEQKSKARLLRGLHSYFLACAEEGKRSLLVVDEAQNLSTNAIEELRMLSNLEWRSQPLLQSFLLGQREFRVILRSEGFEQLRQRVIAAYHLQPLSMDETREYIVHRMVTAGWQGDPAFDERIFPEIYAFTSGVPRRINTLCDRLLLFGYLGQDHTLGMNELAEVSRELIDEGAGPVGELDRFTEGLDPELVSRRPAIAQTAALESQSTTFSESSDSTLHLEAAVRSMQEELNRFREILEKQKTKKRNGNN